jgi:hypothetical protein
MWPISLIVLLSAVGGILTGAAVQFALRLLAKSKNKAKPGPQGAGKPKRGELREPPFGAGSKRALIEDLVDFQFTSKPEYDNFSKAWKASGNAIVSIPYEVEKSTIRIEPVAGIHGVVKSYVIHYEEAAGQCSITFKADWDKVFDHEQVFLHIHQVTIRRRSS